MVEALGIALPFVLAGVFVASGVAKLRTPDDLAGWRELGVPKALRRQWLVAVHPWGELALGAALLLLGGALGLVAALVAVVLMAAYLVLVVRARRETPDASCACFGERRRITGVTVVRNIWLTALAVATASVIWTTPLWGGAIAAVGPQWGWIVALAAAAVTTGVVLWPDAAAPATSPGGGGSAGASAVLGLEPGAVAESVGGSAAAVPAALPAGAPRAGVAADEGEYVRMRTPAVPVTLADGTTVSLRDLTVQRPLLLLAVSEGCGSCTPVIENLGQWRTLLPELDIRFLLGVDPPGSRLTSTDEPQTLHDTHGYVRGSIADWPTPSAVLLGVDGMLAGGPESGADAVAAFVHDIRASLDEIADEIAAVLPGVEVSPG